MLHAEQAGVELLMFTVIWSEISGSNHRQNIARWRGRQRVRVSIDWDTGVLT